MKAKNLPKLPESSSDYWDDSETYLNTPKSIGICASHFKKWHKHDGYMDNHDGTVSCRFCPWGTRLPGYMRCLDGKIVDLRKL